MIYLWRVYDGHMQRFVHSEEIFFNERNISFPFPFYYFANDTTVTARALQEDEIKNDFFLSFFFFAQGTFPLPPPLRHVSYRTRREIIAQREDRE